MGSNGFSSERKQKRVDLLKQLLDTNISTQGSSNPLEALLSGLDLGSLEGLMQKNKKSHHDDWDSKKKRHHDDCSDHDWDHKKKHDHDDCGCKKKKHDHDDCGCKKKKHDHDDCGCDGHKHHKNPCDKCFKHDCCCKDKNKKRCKCSNTVKEDICDVITDIFTELEGTPDRDDLRDLLEDLRDLLDMCSHIPQKFLDELDDLIDDLAGSGTVSQSIITEIVRFLNRLLKCLGFEPGDCGSDGGGGGGRCRCTNLQRDSIADVISDICANISQDVEDINTTDLDQDLTTLVGLVGCVRRNLVRQLNNRIAQLDPGDDDFFGQLTALGNVLNRILRCLGLSELNCRPNPPGGGGGAPIPIPSPITTIRQRLLDLLADQVVITTPTGLYAGTLVAVQADYIAVVAPTGTYLIPLDQIQTFTTE